MTWGYRIIDHGDHKALHEVHYSESGQPVSWTEEPITFVCGDDEDATSIASALSMALDDASREKPLCLVNGRLECSGRVHRADITPMMLERAMADVMLKPSREIALRVRKKMMSEMDDDVIGGIVESHIAFGTACAWEALNERGSDGNPKGGNEVPSRSDDSAVPERQSPEGDRHDPA